MFGNSEYKILKMSNDLHVPRRAWHILTGLIGLAIYYIAGYSPIEMSNILLTLGASVFLVETIRLRNRRFNTFVLKHIGILMREKERNRYSGFVFYAFGVALTLRLFQEDIAIISSIFLILGDPISSMAGIYFGKVRMWQGKSLEGSVAGALTCFVATIVYMVIMGNISSTVLAFAFFAGIIGALAELCTFYVDDNFVIPLFSGFGLSMLNVYFQLF